MVELTWDTAKRDETLAASGLDFADAGEVFAGVRFEFPAEDNPMPDDTIVSVGFQGGRMVVVTWVMRGDERHILSMRRANEREQKNFGDRLGAIGHP